VVILEIQKLVGFNRIYQAECFPDEVKAMFGKNTGDMRRYLKWLYTWLSILDYTRSKYLYPIGGLK